MNYSRVLAIGLSSIFPMSAASAQSDSLASPKLQPPTWEFSLGADPTHLDLRTRAPGVDLRMVGTLTRNWQNPGSHFSRQLSLMVGADAPQGSALGTACYGCWRTMTKQYAALTAGTTADLFRVGRFTPYVHTGAGVYYTRLSGSMATFDDARLTRPPRNDFSFGVNGGLGLKARLFSHEFFIDQTLHAFDARMIDQGVWPLSIGIRW